ncbi:MAG TPA: molybdenum cofactor guanylyltransferase [Ktedonobacteraceae bacterium]|nr:molybdenum cofactor guanylyltransferase [Ktedonobacteraceae bacterium]
MSGMKQGLTEENRTSERDQRPACIILAGGQSRRMGRNKALLPVPGLSGVSFAQHLVSLCMELTGEVLLVAADAAAAEMYTHSIIPRPRVVFDDIPNQGPLMGLYCGLKAIRSSHALVAAVDLPALQPNLVNFLLTQPTKDELVVPLVGGYPQVLLALYPRSILPIIARCLEQGRHNPRALLDLVPVRYLDEAQLAAVDPGLRSFLNVNTPQDLQQL